MKRLIVDVTPYRLTSLQLLSECEGEPERQLGDRIFDRGLELMLTEAYEIHHLRMNTIELAFRQMRKPIPRLYLNMHDGIPF